MFFLNKPVRNVDPTEGAATLRDISRGLLADTLADVQKDTVKRTKLEELRTKDIALYTLTADYKEEKANVNKLVAAERMRFVQRMAQKSDSEREIIQELLRNYLVGVHVASFENGDRTFDYVYRIHR
jgi:outer membrane lipoprotein-sorting protein